MKGIFTIVSLLISLFIVQGAAIDYVQPGDKVYLITPSGALTDSQKTAVMNSIEYMKKEWGLVPILGKNAFKYWSGFGGTPQERLEDIETAMNDTKVRVIMTTRGGYGSAYIIDKAMEMYAKYPSDAPTKFLVGYSDITHHLSAIAKLNNKMKGVHSTMSGSSTFYNNAFTAKKLRDILFGNEIGTYNAKQNANARQGQATAPIVGGNLSILARSLGTKNEIETDGKILFIEDIGETMRKVDSMLYELKRAGKFDKLKGLILGAFTNCTPDNYFKHGDVSIIVANLLKTMNVNYPVGVNFDIGHQYQNNPIPINSDATLIVNASEAHLSFYRA